jgi:proline iminopeptidase
MKCVAYALAFLTSGLQVVTQDPPAKMPGPGYVVPFHGKGDYAPSPRGRIYYEKEGAGPAAFLIAGGPGASHTGFHPWFSRLATDHTMVYLDNVGRGRSDDLKDPKEYTVDGDVADIEALRSRLGFERISLIGHSYGGLPAMAYALRYPTRVDRLVLSNALLSGDDFQADIDSINLQCRNQYPEVWGKLLEMRRQGVKSSAPEYRTIYAQAEADVYWYDLANQGKVFWPEAGERVRSMPVYTAMLGDDPEWSVSGTLKKYDRSDEMRRYRGRVLICTGRYDRVAMPRIAEQIGKLLPNATLVTFERSGHQPWIEETDRYFEVVGRFLSTH